MRRQLLLMLGVAFMVFTMAACEGDVGPAGPQGPPGDPGDIATISCADCHYNDATLVAIERQFSHSPHYDTVYWDRTGSCMECHNHNGFITVAVNGEALPSSFANPAPINCRTCHEIHTTFTVDDYALTTTEAVDLKVGDFFDVGTGNLCVNCHQSRPISPTPEIGGSPITLTAQGGVSPAGNRFGPHYGPQGNVMVASGLIEFAGSTAYPASNPHAADCAACHMQTPVTVTGGGYVAGGHQFGLSWGDTPSQQLIAACTQCHGSASSFDHLGRRSEIQGLLADLRALLEDEGIMRPEDYYANPGTFDADVAVAFLNWKFIYHDGSYGTHNPVYARALLMNAIEAMQARLPTKGQFAAN